MNWKRFAIILTCLCLAVVAGGGALRWGLIQAPDFYETAIETKVDPVVRKQKADKLVKRTLKFVEEIQTSDAWSQEFTEDQINSWLAEELEEKYPEWVPKGVGDPRVKLTQDMIQVGFRFKSEEFSGVISLKLKARVIEPNKLSIEVNSIRAGLLPIPINTVLDEIVTQVETDGWPIEWTTIDGRDVAVVTLAKGKQDEPELKTVEIMPGSFRVTGNRRPTEEPFHLEPTKVARTQ